METPSTDPQGPESPSLKVLITAGGGWGFTCDCSQIPFAPLPLPAFAFMPDPGSGAWGLVIQGPLVAVGNGNVL